MKLIKIVSVFALLTTTAPMVLAVDVERLPDGGATAGLVAASAFALALSRKFFGKK